MNHSQLPMNRIRGLFLAALLSSVPFAAAGELPNGDGRLDYGIEGLPLPPVTVVNMNSPRTAELLAKLLSGEKIAFHRARLVIELGQTKLPDAARPVARGLSDADALVRASACNALAMLCEPGNAAEAARNAVRADATIARRLAELLKDADVTVRTCALRAGFVVEGKAVSAGLIGTLAAADDPAMLACALELAKTPDVGDKIAGQWDRIPTHLRPNVLRAIGRCKSTGQVKMLCGVIADVQKTGASSDVDGVAMMVAAAEALGDLAHADALPTLRELCGHTHATVRRAATRAMGACAPADMARAQGLAMIKDADPTVRQAAVEILTPIMSPQTVVAVSGQLGDEYAPLYAAARAALIAAKDDATRQACIERSGELLDHADARRREDGSYVLGRYRSDYRLERHLELLDHAGLGNDWPLTAQVAESLGLIGRKEAISGIRELANSATGMPDPQSYSPAICKTIIAAARLGISDVLPATQRVLGADPKMADHRQRSAAAFAIGLLSKAGGAGVDNLSALLSSPMENEDTRLEAIKAMGNLKLPDTANRLTQVPTQGAAIVWLRQWAIARATNTPATYEPSQAPYHARLSVTDLTDSNR